MVPGGGVCKGAGAALPLMRILELPVSNLDSIRQYGHGMMLADGTYG
jgi:hypothetical protein